MKKILNIIQVMVGEIYVNFIGIEASLKQMLSLSEEKYLTSHSTHMRGNFMFFLRPIVT